QPEPFPEAAASYPAHPATAAAGAAMTPRFDRKSWSHLDRGVFRSTGGNHGQPHRRPGRVHGTNRDRAALRSADCPREAKPSIGTPGAAGGGKGEDATVT